MVAGVNPQTIKEVKIVDMGWLQMPIILQDGEIVTPKMKMPAILKNEEEVDEEEGDKEPTEV